MTPTETPDITQGGGVSTPARSLAGSEGVGKRFRET